MKENENKKLIKTMYGNISYEFFVENLDWEWSFNYKGKILDFAWHIENNKVVYELNITEVISNVDNMINLYFNSIEELLEDAIIDDKTIKEIWEQLE